MSDLESGEEYRVAIDARKLTPEQDTTARKMAANIGLALGKASVDSSGTPTELKERLWLIPYALLYSLHASIEGCKALDATGFESARDGIFNRRD